MKSKVIYEKETALIIIPDEFLEKLGLEVGDKVDFSKVNEKIIITAEKKRQG